MQSYAWACQKVENSKPSADLPWERPELALPEPQDDFSALQLERGGPKGVGTGAPSCSNAAHAGAEICRQPRAAEPLLLCLQAGLTPLDETCYLLTNPRVTALQLGPVIHKQDYPCAGLSPACTPGPRALPPPDEET